MVLVAIKAAKDREVRGLGNGHVLFLDKVPDSNVYYLRVRNSRGVYHIESLTTYDPKYLSKMAAEFRGKLEEDPDYFDSLRSAHQQVHC